MLSAKLKAVSDEERGAQRFRLLLQASAETRETGLVDVSIHDLSVTGFLIECSDTLGIGDEISLEIPGVGTATGDLVWSSGRFFGGEFRRPLPAAALASAQGSSPVLWADFVPTSAADRSLGPLLVEPAPRPSEAVQHDDRLPIGWVLQIVVAASILFWTPLALALWSILG